MADIVADIVSPISPILKVVAGILHSKFAAELAPQMIDDKYVEMVTPALDKIQAGINDLKMKDLKVSKAKVDKVLIAIRQKFGDFKNVSESNKIWMTAEIEADLKSAQESAINASVAGLKTSAKIDSIKWIIITELMRVLNAMTEKEELNADEAERVKMKFTTAHEVCNAYLRELNALPSITEFIASKITVEGYKSPFKLMSNDRYHDINEVISINVQVNNFVSFMKANYGMAIMDAQENSRPSTSTELEVLGAISIAAEKTKPLLMGMDPFVLGLELYAKDQRPELKAIIMHELPKLFPTLDEVTNTKSLEAVVAILNATGKASTMKWKEVAHLKNGGEVSASSSNNSYYPPEKAFGDDGSWVSQFFSARGIDKNNCDEFLQRKLASAATPLIFAMQSGIYGGGDDAPTKFEVVGQEEAGGEWVTMVEADEVQWKDDQWKYWVVRSRRCVSVVKVKMHKCKYDSIWVQNIRLYC